jgi:hypothetical protein
MRERLCRLRRGSSAATSDVESGVRAPGIAVRMRVEPKTFFSGKTSIQRSPGRQAVHQRAVLIGLQGHQLYRHYLSALLLHHTCF